MDSQAKSDAAIGIGFALFALAMLVAVREQVGELGSEETIIPLIGTVMVFVFGAGLAVRALVVAPAETDEDETPLTRLQRTKMLAAAALLLVHAWLLPRLGIIVAGFSLQFLFYLLLGVRLAPAIAVSAAVVAAVYVFIHLVLGAPLPLGTLW